MDGKVIEIIGAREHNLKNVSLVLPRNKLIVFTGLSGSGKSSLAFDTIFAEGQRRYLETFSSYARQFIGNLERPEVDKINGLSPVIAIEQKTVSRNPRSTVGTITEVYDFFRLLFARVSTAYSPTTGKPMQKFNNDQIYQQIKNRFPSKKVAVLAPLVKGRKGHYRELFERLMKQGYSVVRVDGKYLEMKQGMSLDRYKLHDVELVIDRIEVNDKSAKRLYTAVEQALGKGDGEVMVEVAEGNQEPLRFSKNLMCPDSGISLPDPEPNLFSFNSPYGACKRCNGIGAISVFDKSKVMPDKRLSIEKGGIAPLGRVKRSWIFEIIENILEEFNCSLKTPVGQIPDAAIECILIGTSGTAAKDENSEFGFYEFEGILNYMRERYDEDPSPALKKWIEGFLNTQECPDCHGSRLKPEAMHFKIAGKTISEISVMDIQSLKLFANSIPEVLSEVQKEISREVLKEINARIQFLTDVGLDYLSLNRTAGTLSGGEAQRIRLATQMGTELTNVLYILDEPSIGLHQRDNRRLIDSLKKLRNGGNTVIVVEHDREMIESGDYIVDIGPGAGTEGGSIVFAGKPADMHQSGTTTSEYISGKAYFEIPEVRRKGSGKMVEIIGCKGNNLKNVNLKLPLGALVSITGVSGSGKSSLINHTLYPALLKHFKIATKEPLEYKAIKGLEHIDKVIAIDQTPIGKTPRSNPATYTGVFTHIRDLFTQLPEAAIRGYKPGRFSFNVKGGRCEQCKGGGLRLVEMNFLPDVYVVCEQCRGKRYNRETLEVRFKGKSINDVLEMRIDDALEFFENVPRIRRVVQTLHDVGLGYISLGQSSTTLSGGESQRVKLATELTRRDTGKTIYLMDEPTTGLHFRDISVLMEVLNKLVNRGNTVVIIEHNLDVVKMADWVIDVGPEGGAKGGFILFEGTPEQLAKQTHSATAPFLAAELSLHKKTKKKKQ
jgi:excinuclease ABC subunit A